MIFYMLQSKKINFMFTLRYVVLPIVTFISFGKIVRLRCTPFSFVRVFVFYKGDESIIFPFDDQSPVSNPADISNKQVELRVLSLS